MKSTLTLTAPQSALLDFLRGGSAQLVLIGHALSASGLAPKLPMQDLGVVVFFVLSGFLITLSARSKTTFSDWFIDRFARVFTPYIPALIFIVGAGTLLQLEGPHDPGTLALNAAMLQDFPLWRYLAFPEIDRLGTGRPLWSVAMEWWFYMAFGGIFFLRKLPIWSIPLIAIGFFIFAFNATVGMLAFTWAAGSVAALTWSQFPKARWLPFLLAVLALAAYRLKIAPDKFYDLALNLLIALAVIVSIKFVEDKEFSASFSKFSKWLASYSYTLYLTHYTVLVSLSFLTGWTRVFTVFFLSNAIALGMYYLFERHHKKVSLLIRRKSALKPA